MHRVYNILLQFNLILQLITSRHQALYVCGKIIPLQKFNILRLATNVQAFVIPHTLESQEVFSLVNEEVKHVAGELPLVDSEALQNLITLDELNATAIDLYSIAQLSLEQYDHPTRVIGSRGHWGTIGYILKELKKLKQFYTFETQEFKALNGKVFNYTLKLNGEKIQKVEPFQMTPAAHVKDGEIFVVKNKGCEVSDYKGLSLETPKIALIERGICPFGTKSSLAGKFGAKAALIYDADSEEIITGTLGEPTETVVGTLGITRSFAKNLTDGVALDLDINAYVGYIKTKNVIAETIDGDHDNVVSLGAHSDSVAAGPGINDDGSGTISLLAVAKHLSNFKLNNAVRFAWWAAEEEGLLGSNYYANSLTPEENAKIRLFMDYDMMASPNYEYQVYDGSNSVNPKGSEEIKNLYIDWYESKGLNWTLIPFDGRSDYVGFIENGIPGGGIAAGAEKENLQNGEVLDKCYHQLCDDLTNLAWDAFLINTKLIAHSVATYSRDLSNFPERESSAVKSADSDLRFIYRGILYKIFSLSQYPISLEPLEFCNSHSLGWIAFHVVAVVAVVVFVVFVVFVAGIVVVGGGAVVELYIPVACIVESFSHYL
ncbi:hypothetical protein WICMUC_004363 [Wickerhamomyces mucosus]|uniref:Peptide hydrolase n=1 Tax=Wickerhamomyces mucosus TaxID=1378264 RepID=A0A9P8PH75_9ASCO|nr:hypothetical protein WICMUC_004363 [Wickerhamomyces mucosus]